MALKKIFVWTFFLLLLTSLILQATPGSSAVTTNKERAVTFLEDVVLLDMSKYSVELKYYNDNSAIATSISYDEDATYILKGNDDSQHKAKFFFRDTTKFYCNMGVAKVPLAVLSSTTNRLDIAKEFMSRYQNFAEGTYIQPLVEMLDKVTEIKNQTITDRDVVLIIEPSPVGEDFVTFQWMYAPNGIHNRFTRVTLMLQNGELRQFTDYWQNCVLGSAEVSVSEEEAINLAKGHIAAYSYQFGNKTVRDLTVTDNPEWITAKLSMQPRHGNELYPRWELLVALKDVYPGLVTAMHLYLWADTGELSLIETSAGGGMPPEPSDDQTIEPTDQSAATPSQTSGSPQNTGSAVNLFDLALPIGIIAFLTATTATIIFYRKRKKPL
ncbi:MAG: hypothetical protein NWE92_03100 [Candidatus Bathyarchaeota archaeon]|nr:hypothetical protein [Candidatus Bathyarchaeota archaeon]